MEGSCFSGENVVSPRGAAACVQSPHGVPSVRSFREERKIATGKEILRPDRLKGPYPWVSVRRDVVTTWLSDPVWACTPFLLQLARQRLSTHLCFYSLVEIVVLSPVHSFQLWLCLFSLWPFLCSPSQVSVSTPAGGLITLTLVHLL